MTQMPHHEWHPKRNRAAHSPSDIRNENAPSIRFSTTPGKEPRVELGLA
jgi:hypothetical protein